MTSPHSSIPPGPPVPSKICPHCAAQAWTTEDRCPYCHRRYRKGLPAWAWPTIPLAIVLLVAGGVGGALLLSGDDNEDQSSSSPPLAPEPVQETEPTAVPETEAEPNPDDCDAKGINPEQRREGTCVEPSGQRVKVVNRTSTLRLDELNVSVVGTELKKSITSDIDATTASGMFYVVTLRVKNKLDSPVTFDNSQEQVALKIDGKNYSQDFEAENTPGNPTSFVWNSEEIQPDEERTGTVVFDVPRKAIKKLDDPVAAPNLIVVNFSDADSLDEEPSVFGVIRLYD